MERGFGSHHRKMARFDDDERLPHGFSVIGYNADTSEYTAEDEDGSLWVSPPGTKNGEWQRIRGPTKAPPASGSLSRPRTANSQATSSDPTRFSAFLDPQALALPTESKATNKSSFRRKMAEGAKNAIKRVTSLRKTDKKPSEVLPPRSEPRPGFEAIRLPPQDEGSQRKG
ncbi:uncharacterized protein F4807DRAFT_414880 [Annulohypoxylon truncatum]|uniref:uncharacterized protein n=1 Tax=Annulohypoxylon truncatum TaxID=327061 RepID=UPI0020073579|nr:uncharacterized protein F4807DRAFT_414880 [Annulohypoxylon truncatum]KAI1212149.1 hypothetical protein F4807DRAFT_414880 [Annulohypoxylon truncatum]